MRARAGFTLIELVVAIALMVALSAAFVELFVPQMRAFLALPEQHIVQSAASDVLDAITEGDAVAKGLRSAGLSGSSEILSAADGTSLTFHYQGQDGVDHSVAFTYDGANKRFFRNVDSGGDVNVPSYGQGAGASTRVVIDVIDTRFFRYYDSVGTEFVPPLSAANRALVRRVDVALRVGLGSGTIDTTRPAVSLKTGVDIKNTA